MHAQFNLAIIIKVRCNFAHARWILHHIIDFSMITCMYMCTGIILTIIDGRLHGGK
jgi:hypothetical protein